MTSESSDITDKFLLLNKSQRSNCVLQKDTAKTRSRISVELRLLFKRSKKKLSQELI